MNYIFSDQLSHTRTNLINEIVLLPFDEFNNKPNPHTWSIAQICHHLYLTEKVFADAIVYGLNKQNSQPTNSKNVSLALDRTTKLPAPEIVYPSRELMEVEPIITLLNDSRKRIIDVLSNIKDPSSLEEKSAKHPVFGELRLHQWVELIYLHEQRHIEQIKETKAVIHP
ncbi:DinB family protein [Neobacillus sp. D3-1R]|uniref:DinB family protein n=1 Tax=Neobacillus sp. D3-1R TaxID=3445778 RepID=UPI003FA03C63